MQWKISILVQKKTYILSINVCRSLTVYEDGSQLFIEREPTQKWSCLVDKHSDLLMDS